ncbi:putative primary ciliary dyskinesia protein 1 [Scophthalmus maximus]|uniref:Putative primary ciliary dyskinesia protein 1 n=1 Tax=Scophthalmus maximus TaxID=52904 RepID=A0A2U9AV85_SCOMX|nr:putative primary ciliary dyskinesia protein 1 [Scophthalmus maximus]
MALVDDDKSLSNVVIQCNETTTLDELTPCVLASGRFPHEEPELLTFLFYIRTRMAVAPSAPQSNSLIEAEPPELHFSGFELGKDSLKTLKLINISSEVVNIHIIPTQTKHFQTTYTKKYRLIPGLAYTLQLSFCPDEWRYFYDCVRVHCKGEENLLIPVHAYPVIDDLHIPPRIDLSFVPLGQSVRHVIPLRCSCPIDFEFQVYVVQAHEAFSIHPLTGVIPANGEVKLTVTFSPLQYETCQVTMQLVVSQFNTKPYLCTVTGSSAPHPALSHLDTKLGHGDAAQAERKWPSPATQVLPRSKTRHRPIKEADKSKTLRDQSGSKPLDVSTPAGVAKMLIKDTTKLSSKALKEALSCGGMVLLQSKQMKEALFMKKAQQNVNDEQANHLSWQVHLGKDPVSGQTKRQMLEEREIALHEYMVKRGDVSQEEEFPAGRPKLSSSCVLLEAGQAPEGAPSFQLYSSFQWELKQRALRLFQQAARKVVIRCRMKRRLACWKKLADGARNMPPAHTDGEETTCDEEISPDKVLPFSFPAHSDLVAAPAAPGDVTVTTRIPLFKLQVPQHYKLMGYRPVSTWEAFNSYIPTTLARPLRTGAPVGFGAAEAKAEEEEEAVEAARLSFTAPGDLLRPFPANPLRIFNPAPGLQTYKPTPKYLESDLEFHLCPLPRYRVAGSNSCGSATQRKFLDRKEVIKGVMTWKNFDSIALNCVSKQPALTSGCAPRRSVDYSPDILPLSAPPPLTRLPDDLTPLMDKACPDSGVQLTPEMIRAEFLSGEALVATSNLAGGATARHRAELQTEATHRCEFNQMGRRVATRLQQLGITEDASQFPACSDKSLEIRSASAHSDPYMSAATVKSHQQLHSADDCIE